MYFRGPGITTRKIVRVSLPGSDFTGASGAGLIGVGVIGIGIRESLYSINRIYYSLYATQKKPAIFRFFRQK